MAGQIPDKTYLTTRQYADASNLRARGSAHARFGVNPYPWFRWLYDQARSLAAPNARILEVGAGPAGLWAENLDRLPPGWRITLTDLSAGMVETARHQLEAAGSASQFAFAQADAERLPFADGVFDLVMANHMLYHVPDRPQALAELRRVLVTGGALLAATNGDANLLELNEALDTVAPGASASAWRASFRRPFTLENAPEQLAPFFDQIETRAYPDALDVTEAEPLVEYVRSLDAPGLREPAALAALARYFQDAIDRNGGVYHIQKSVGVLAARRRE